MRLEIREYEPALREIFEEQFIDYNDNDLHMPQRDPRITHEVLREKIVPLFLRTWEKGAGSIAMAFADGEPAGFVCYQVDSEESDWCRRSGWGLIREFYIVPMFRRRGVGRALAAYAEERLRQKADRLYLTANLPEEDGGRALAFWTACGWRETGEVNENGTRTMEK